MEDITQKNLTALKENIKNKKKILVGMNMLLKKLDDIDKGLADGDKKSLNVSLDSYIYQLKALNNSLPELVSSLSLYKGLPPSKIVLPKKEEKSNLVSLKVQSPIGGESSYVTISKADKSNFIKKLSLTTQSLRKIKKEEGKLKIEEETLKFKKPSAYAKISNKFFSKLSGDLLNKGYFSSLNRELRKANLSFLTQTYISIAFFTAVLSFFVAIVIVLTFLFFNFSLEYPFLTFMSESIPIRLLKVFWLLFAIPIVTFIAIYLYPSTEKKSLAGKIDEELPFIVIHMSAIAGSGMEPSKMFRIIVKGKEYPNTKKEFKKLLNEVNVYGYDIVTALRNVARLTSSTKLSELFNGLAMTITSGGSLKQFLDEHSEGLVFDYRLEREKYTKTAETLMDIYISVVIAAPMIMTMMLVLISFIGADFGMGPQVLSTLMILGVALINVVFLVLLHFKQPGD